MKAADIMGQRLREIREQYRYTQEEMGQLIGVARQTMARYLQGEQVMPSDKLYVLARHFNRPLDFFLHPSQDDPSLTFMFRAEDPANDVDSQTRRYLASRFEQYSEIIEMSGSGVREYLPSEYKLNIKGKELSKDNKRLIAEIAIRQRKYLGIDDAIGVNVFRLLSSNNIHIIAESADNPDLDAVSAYAPDRGAFIFVNDCKDIPEERKTFSLIHELGHLIMHRDEYTADPGDLEYTKSRVKDVREKMADCFAGYFLIPPDVLKYEYRSQISGYLTLEAILDIKVDFGVSAKALIYALYIYDLIDDRTMGKLFALLREKGYEKREPGPRMQPLKKNEKLTGLVRQLAIEDRISVNRTAEVLGISIKEARQRIKQWKSLEHV